MRCALGRRHRICRSDWCRRFAGGSYEGHGIRARDNVKVLLYRTIRAQQRCRLPCMTGAMSGSPRELLATGVRAVPNSSRDETGSDKSKYAEDGLCSPTHEETFPCGGGPGVNVADPTTSAHRARGSRHIIASVRHHGAHRRCAISGRLTAQGGGRRQPSGPRPESSTFCHRPECLVLPDDVADQQTCAEVEATTHVLKAQGISSVTTAQ